VKIQPTPSCPICLKVTESKQTEVQYRAGHRKTADHRRRWEKASIEDKQKYAKWEPKETSQKAKATPAPTSTPTVGDLAASSSLGVHPIPSPSAKDLTLLDTVVAFASTYKLHQAASAVQSGEARDKEDMALRKTIPTTTTPSTSEGLGAHRSSPLRPTLKGNQLLASTKTVNDVHTCVIPFHPPVTFGDGSFLARCREMQKLSHNLEPEELSGWGDGNDSEDKVGSSNFEELFGKDTRGFITTADDNVKTTEPSFLDEAFSSEESLSDGFTAENMAVQDCDDCYLAEDR
jgi:hypothetical protein